MSFTIFQASAPTFLLGLNALSKILDKAEADAAARKYDPAVLLGFRLAPDMLPFTRQVHIMTDFAKSTMARLAGVEVPKYEDNETTIAELKARIAKVISYVQSFKAADLVGAESREITIPVGGQPMTFTGQDYLITHALPNFYFHATTAYAILRHCGVGIGKRDFLNRN